jgi:aminoglycoside phosphotransferase (APT) family kinase protein
VTPDTAEDLKERLQVYLARMGSALRVRSLSPIDGGMENVIVRVEFELAHASSRSAWTEAPLVMRLCRRSDSAEAMEREARVMGAARRAGVPAPRVRMLGRDAQEFEGAFLLMDLIPGERLDLALMRSSGALTLRLLRAMARTQMSIYQISWRPPPSRLSEPAWPERRLRHPIDGRIAGADADLHGYGLADLRPVLDWLLRHRRDLGRRRMSACTGIFTHAICSPRMAR